MVAAGYKTFNIDDCWPALNRSASGDIVPDPEKFPEGMKAFSTALATHGLGLGIYTAHGELTCCNYPGALGHEAADAATYASWGVQFLKNDWCWHDEMSEEKHLQAFNAMRDALNATGKPITYSVHWNYDEVAGPGCAKDANCPLPATANMWRVAGDIVPTWASVLDKLDAANNAPTVAQPGQWNDPDMLEVGNGMTSDQDRAHFTMWCMLAAPLIAGNDVRNMSETTRGILTNQHAIAVNQDPLGKQATVVQSEGSNGTQVWVKPLASGDVAVALLNRAESGAKISFNFSAAIANAAAEVFDLWDGGRSLGIMHEQLSVTVAPTAAVMYRLRPNVQGGVVGNARQR